LAPARVYIVDEHSTIRTALAERLSRAADLQVIGHTGDWKDVIEEVRSLNPDVVLVEIKRSDGMGLELVRELAGLPGAPGLLVLTSYLSSWEEDAARRAGAASYLLKDIDPEELIRRITEVAAAHASSQPSPIADASEGDSA
jgi:DNA-binding NarL/FixJ family response regulator